jgi:hypothetical protein
MITELGVKQVPWARERSPWGVRKNSGGVRKNSGGVKQVPWVRKDVPGGSGKIPGGSGKIPGGGQTGSLDPGARSLRGLPCSLRGQRDFRGSGKVSLSPPGKFPGPTGKISGTREKFPEFRNSPWGLFSQGVRNFFRGGTSFPVPGNAQEPPRKCFSSGGRKFSGGVFPGTGKTPGKRKYFTVVLCKGGTRGMRVYRSLR